jgi:hypothetical protein
MTGAAGQDGGQRRFRQRGGAKKKKKTRLPDALPNDVDRHPSPAGPYYPPGAAAPPRQPQECQLDPELARYLYQLRDDMDRLEREDGRAVGPDGDDEPPSILLARNGLVSLQANLHEVAMEPMGSRVLETLVRTARADTDVLAGTLSALLALGSRRVAALADHRCGSHVLQSLVLAVSSAVAAEGGGEAGMAAMQALGRLINEWTLPEVVAVMSSSCGSHVFRAIVAGLAGIPAEEPREAKLDDAAGSTRLATYIELGGVDVPQEWLACVSALGQRLVDGDTGGGLHSLLWAPSSSAALQGLVAATSRADRDVTKKLVTAALQESALLNVCFDGCGARFMERVVVCLGAGHVLPELKGHLADMAVDGKANFVLQRVLLGLKGRGAVMSAWDELEDALPEMTGFGSVRDGVVLAMLRAAEVEGDEHVRRRAARAIAKSVGAVGVHARHLAGVLVVGSLERWELWRSAVQAWSTRGMGISPAPTAPDDDLTSVLHFGASPGTSLLGVLMARSLMRYSGGPGQACRDSMANLTAAEVLALCSQPAGSRLVEQWTVSDEEFGNGKATSFVVTSLMDAGAIGAACRSPYGAQVLIRTIPRAAGVVRKRAMEALAARAPHLREHKHGRQVIRRCRVDDYMRRGDDWSAVETLRDTRHRLFEEILLPAEDAGDVAGGAKEVRGTKGKRKREAAARKRDEGVDDGGVGLDNVLAAIGKVAADGEKKKKKKKRTKR